MRHTKLTLTIFLSIFSLATGQSAVLINIGSSGYTATLSTLAPLPEGFSFQLGSFGAITPTSSNTNIWSTNWTSLGSGGSWSAFDDFDFNGTLADSNPPPFTVGGQAYLWGFNTQTIAPTTEWVLLTNVNWSWPVSPVGPGNPVVWNLADTGPTSAIVGSINNTSDSFQTEVIPEPTTMALFAASLTAVMVLRRRRHS